ncbi:hypothetical protein FHX45_005235 [Amycolatopsis granulosa]|nr:hypothetical protein [Amycolatopsis granulosa]
MFHPDPGLTTLGEYALPDAEGGWRIRSLTVTRTR